MKHLLYFCVIAFLCSCSDENREFSSDSPSNEESSTHSKPEAKVDTKNKTQKKPEFFVFTNDFQSDQGELDRPYIRLVGSNDQAYIVPPVEYEDIALPSVVVKDVKAKNGCVKVPKHAFPISVNVCETYTCEKSRYLADLNFPSHYGIFGMGDLFIPQINPVSPCSDDFKHLMIKKTPETPVKL